MCVTPKETSSLSFETVSPIACTRVVSAGQNPNHLQVSISPAANKQSGHFSQNIASLKLVKAKEI